MKLLLAVSGGIDSVYMAEQFYRKEGAADLAVAHCNFHLRGAESDADEAFVRAWCDARGVRLFTASFDTRAEAARRGVSLEMAARALRYAWFARLCREEGYDAVAVAHNADDNAETLLLNLLRGTGQRGLCGMRRDGTVPDAQDVRLLRPLLGTTREEIRAWMEANGVAYRTDGTNADVSLRRNRIRHRVFPEFRQINPSFVRTLGQDMAHFAQADAIAEDYFLEHRGSLLRENRIDLQGLLALRHWEYLLYRLLEPYGLHPDTFEALVKTLREADTVSGKVFRGGAHRIVTARGALLIDPPEADGAGETLVPAPGEYRLAGRTLTVARSPRDPQMPLRQPDGTSVLDAAGLPWPVKVRPWRPGDWMHPSGMKGRKKLSDLFADLHYSAVDKHQALVLPDPADEHHILSLLGRRTDASVLVRESTEEVLVFHLK